jgi:2,6-dihydroxypyridine 3-monooxygenase
VYRALLGALGVDAYRRGHALVGFDQDPDGVDLRFANGAGVRVDMLVCADGVASTARRRLLPGVEPAYSGNVGWRGTLSESLLTPETFAVLGDAITYGLVEHSHVVIRSPA